MVHRGATVSNNRRNPRAKWVLPDVVNPPDRVCFKISVPNNRFHIAAFKGALYMLSSAIFWQDDTAHTAKQVARVWQDIFDEIIVADCNTVVNRDGFMEVDTMAGMFEPYCDDKGKCRFHFKCDVCGDWHDVALVTDLVTNPSGAGNQPAPDGGVSTDCATIYCNQEYTIPVPVSTGDKVEITSAVGKWSDQFARWLCIDGNLFFISCTGVGGAAGAAGDVLMSAYHLSAVVRFSTGYYALYPGGSLIVPAGVSNEQPTILANKPAVNSGSGTIDICWKVTNNKTSTFVHTFDMTVSPQGWSAIGTSPLSALWNPGVGWGSQPGTASATLLDIQSPAVAGFTLTQVEVLYTTDLDNGSGGARATGTPPGYTVYGSLATGAGAFDTVLTVTRAGVTRFYISIDRNGSPLGNYNVSKVIISGNGPDPF